MPLDYAPLGVFELDEQFDAVARLRSSTGFAIPSFDGKTPLVLQRKGEQPKYPAKDRLLTLVPKHANLRLANVGERLMNISGTDDRLIPYRGGPSPAIPAKGDKLGFVDAEESIFLWAKAMGYKGEKLTRPTKVIGKLEIFSYLDGDVVHYKVSGEGHGATGAIDEKTLLEFLNNTQ